GLPPAPDGAKCGHSWTTGAGHRPTGACRDQNGRLKGAGPVESLDGAPKNGPPSLRFPPAKTCTWSTPTFHPASTWSPRHPKCYPGFWQNGGRCPTTTPTSSADL